MFGTRRAGDIRLPKYTLDSSMAEIGARQTQEVNLRRQAAARDRYTAAKLPDTLVIWGNVALAGFAPVALFYFPDLSEVVAALAGFWLFVSRLLLRPISDRLKTTAAALQDDYDRTVFGLEPRSTTSPVASDEELRHWTQRADLKEFRDWYPTRLDLPWPKSVLICQRASTVWARRQHGAYGNVLVAVAVVWFALGVAIAFGDDISLRSYLVAILMPSLPALLESAELARLHHKAAADRRSVESTLNAFLTAPGQVTRADLDGVQERLRSLRIEGPLVPDWFYRRISDAYDADMHFAAQLQAESGEGAVHGHDD